MERKPLLPDSPRVRRWRDWTGPYPLILLLVLLCLIGLWIAADFRTAAKLAFAPALLFFALTPSMERRRKKWSDAEERAGFAELEHGEFANAAARFTRMRQRYASSPLRWRTATFNLAAAELGRGELARAAALLEEIERPRAKRSRIFFALPQAASQLALVHAFAGELDAARAWLAEAERRGNALHDRILPQLVIELRGGSATTARDLLAERWPEIERVHAVASAKELRLLRAFALERTGAAREDVEAQLAHVRDARAAAFTPFTAAWPELRAFAERHGLVQG